MSMVLEAVIRELPTILIAGLTAMAVVLMPLPGKEWFLRRSYKKRIDIDYEADQRKALAEVIGRHHGLIVDASDRLSHRMVNIDNHIDKGWLNPKHPESDGYFLDSTIYRFVTLIGAMEALEQEALIIDSRDGRDDDQRLIWYARAFRWSLTEAKLFDGTGYDPEVATCHFFTEELRDMGRFGLTYCENVSFGEFRGLSRRDRRLAPARRFFSSLEGGGLIWDRLMVCRLIILGFLNEFGDDLQRSGHEWFDRAAMSIESDHVAKNFGEDWLPRFHLESVLLEEAMEKRLEST